MLVRSLCQSGSGLNFVPFAENIDKEKNHCTAQCPPQRIWNPPTHWPTKIRRSSPHLPTFSKPQLRPSFTYFPGNRFPGKQCSEQNKKQYFWITKVYPRSEVSGFGISGAKRFRLGINIWLCFGGHALVKCFVSTTVCLRRK